MVGDAVERLAAAYPDPPAHERTLLELLRKLAHVLDDPDTPAYAVAGAARELRAAAGELRGLVRPAVSERDQFLRSRGLEPSGDEGLDDFLARIQWTDGPGD